MQERGYVKGRNLIFEIRHHEGRIERFPALVAELVTPKRLELLEAAGPKAARVVAPASVP